MKLSGFAGNAFSATVGAFLDLPRLKVGVAYQPPIRVHNHGRIVLEPEGQKLRDVIGERAAEADAEMSFTLPDNLKASIDFYPRPRLRLRLYGEWVGWSRFDAIRIRVSQRTLSLLPELITEQQRFHDAFGLRLQGKHWLRGQGGERSERGLALFAGLGYDASAVPDETLSTQFVDADKLSLSFGVDLGLGESFRGKLALQYTHFFARTVKGSTRVPSADGRYGAELVMIDLNLAYARQ
jgi:long-subunit fatty acid transport protein